VVVANFEKADLLLFGDWIQGTGNVSAPLFVLYPRPREYLARSYPLDFRSSANCGGLFYGSWFSVCTTLNTRGLVRVGHLAIYRTGYRRCGLRCSGHRLQTFVSIHIESAVFFSQSPVSHENRKASRLRQQQVPCGCWYTIVRISTVMTLKIAVLAFDTL